MRARSVFTATTISPSPPLRQRSACYTIRARRNFTLVPVFRQGIDYSFSAYAEPACDHQQLTWRSHPFGFSRYGVCNVVQTSHGITLPSSLRPCRSSGEGFTVISRYGLACAYPTRNFATLGPFVLLRLLRAVGLLTHSAYCYAGRTISSPHSLLVESGV